MAVTITFSNHAKYQFMKKQIDLESDTLKIILMKDSFTFSEDLHVTLANVTADQLAGGNGYVQNDRVLTSKAVYEDDGQNRGEFECDDVTFTAAGGPIGPTGSYIIYDESTPDNTVILCADFGMDYTIADGNSLQFKNIRINLT